MNKMMLYVGLVLFSPFMIAMDPDQPIKKMNHKDQLYFLTKEDQPAAFKVDFVSREEIKNNYPVCEMRPENASNPNTKINIITAVGDGYLSFLPNSSRPSNTREVVNAIKQQCVGFEKNARMRLVALNDFYFDMVIDIDANEIENLIDSIENN